ncbi:PLP-dependent aminotransferase family protein [Comamonadaceae bacterium PP-2]
MKKANLSWIRPLQEGGGPRYQQITLQIVGAVEDGVLRPGDRLPPQRDLAQQFGVDLTTVTRAYSEVRQRGLLEAQGAGGTYIANPGDAETATIDLGMNIPPLLNSAAFLQLLETGSAHARDHCTSHELMSYHVGAGARRDREAAAQWLKPMMGALDPERIVICPGAQAAIAALLLVCTQSGDLLVTDEMTYPGFLAAARVLQREVAGVPSDAEGMDPGALERLCEKQRPALLYLNPTIQNPTTATLSEARRRILRDIAARFSIPIIEDDPYWLLAESAPTPLARLDAPDAAAPVYYISTLSKCLAPGLRTAYLVVPPAQPVAPVLDALRSLTLMPTPWMTAVATHWIGSGIADQWLEQVRKELKARQALAASILPGKLSADPCGLHLWLQLPRHIDPYRLMQTAQQHGLGVSDSDAFAATDVSPSSIRISLGGANDQARLAQGLSKLAELLRSDVSRRISNVV